MNTIVIERMKEDKVLVILTIMLLLILTVVMLSSCTKEQEQPENRVPLLLSGSTTMPVSITRGNNQSATRSGSPTVDLPASTQAGVYALATGTNATTVTTTTQKNTLYTATGSNGSFTTATPITLEYRQSYQVCAYAPYQSTVSDPTAVTFNHGTDVLYAPLTNVTITGPTATAALQFVHKVSQIQFNLTAGTGTPDLTGVTLSVSGFKSTCTLNLSDGTMTPVSGSGATVTDQNKAVCFIPDSHPMTLSIAVSTKDGKSYTGTITQTFSASNSYSYTLTVNKSQTELGVSLQLVDWITVSGGSVKVWPN